MLGYLDFLFLGFSGRIGRTAYSLSTLVLGVVQCAAVFGVVWLARDSIVGLEPHSQHAAEIVMNHLILPASIVAAIFLYPQLAIMTKRWHDRGKSGWWWLIGFVPIIGGLWMLIELGFLAGEEGTNAYGYR